MNLLRRIWDAAAGLTRRFFKSALQRLWSIVVVATKRLVSQRWLALATALGLVIAVALTVSIPIYTDGVYYRILRERISTTAEGLLPHPPFGFLFRYVGAWKGRLEWEDVQPVDAYLSERVGAELALPEQLSVRYFETDRFRMFPAEDVEYTDNTDPLAWVSLGFLSDAEDHIDVVEGGFPVVAELSDESTIEVLMSEPLATRLGIQVGESYTIFARRTLEGGQERSVQVPIRVAGVWIPRDLEEEYWFWHSSYFDDVMLVPEGTFVGRISAYLDEEVNLAVWYSVMDGSQVFADDVAGLVARITRLEQKATALLPYIELAPSFSPREELERYRYDTRNLSILLYAFDVPILSLILAFVGLVVGLSVARQRSEIAVLRSRGATALQVLGIAALEGLLVGIAALLIGLLAGGIFARLIGKTRSFLDFSLQSDLRIGFTATTLRFGLIAIGLALAAQVLPSIGASRHTIVTYKQERARSLQRSWWQRFYLDFVLLGVAAYGAHMLRAQGSIVADLGQGDPFQNPLLFLVPAVGAFAFSLLILRILPVIITGVAWVASRTNGVSVLLASRHLSRTPGFYTAPLVLLVLTLSLSTFTASLAQTLDQHLHDQMRYRVGADMRLTEMGEDTQADVPPGFVATVADDEEDEGPRWLFLPVSEHLEVEDVQGAARVGTYRATSFVGGGAQAGTYIGVDWWDFHQVAFWRDDFAAEPLVGLMNRLAVYPDGVLVHSRFMGQHTLRAGDTIRVVVDTEGRNELDLRVVGVFDLFPTWYPETLEGEYQPLFVGNLDYLFEQSGSQFPYNVWLKTDEGTDYEQVVDGVRGLGLNVLGWDAPLPRIIEEQRRPERQGLFGVLSVGFLAASLLTVLGFLLYAFFSFRRRFIELGILRAIGLSAQQMTGFLAWELAFLILTGAVAGTGLGAWISRLFIPALQLGTSVQSQVPPFVVDIAWSAVTRIYVLFGLLFVAALAGLAALLMRMKIFQAVKLGETT